MGAGFARLKRMRAARSAPGHVARDDMTRMVVVNKDSEGDGHDEVAVEQRSAVPAFLFRRYPLLLLAAKHHTWL